MLKISCWNTDWATPTSKRGKFFIDKFDSDIICLTEGYETLLPEDGYIISSHENFGYETKNGRRIRRWKHPNPNVENTLYKASHINHPSAIWTRESIANYIWLHSLFENLCDEYTHRYGKVHYTDSLLRELLRTPPVNIEEKGLTEIPQAMPDDVKGDDSILAYRNYYIKYKKDFAKWTNRETPTWMMM